MRSHRKGSAAWIGVVAGLLLHGIGGWWSSVALAQSGLLTINTTTTSTSSSTSFESPPSCSPVGSSRIVQTVTFEETIGPGTIIIGDRDTGGTAFEVLAGTTNLNVNTHTETVQCVVAGAIPTLSEWAMIMLAALLVLFGMGGIRRHAM